jgi:hypothetical protein
LGLIVVSTAVAVAIAGRSSRWHEQQAAGHGLGAATLQTFPPSEKTVTVMGRLKVKRDVVKRLLEGELTLLEAGAWFRHVNDNPPDCPCEFRNFMRGDSDGEKVCRQVIAWVRGHLIDALPESQVLLTVRKLEDELDALVAEHGTVELPW